MGNNDLPHGAQPVTRRQPDANPLEVPQRPGAVQVAQAVPRPPAVSQVTQGVVAGPAPSTVTSIHEAAGGSASSPGVKLSAPVIAASTLPVQASASRPVPPVVQGRSEPVAPPPAVAVEVPADEPQLEPASDEVTSVDAVAVTAEDAAWRSFHEQSDLTESEEQ